MKKAEASWGAKVKDLCEKLDALNVTFVVVSYQGEGDSGCTENAQYFTEPEEPEEGETASKVDVPEELDTDVNDVLNEALSEEYSGWEDGNGSTGRIILNVKNQTIKFDHGWYVHDTETDAREFSL